MELTICLPESKKRLFELCMREEVDEVRYLLESLSGLSEDERRDVLHYKDIDEVSES